MREFTNVIEAEVTLGALADSYLASGGEWLTPGTRLQGAEHDANPDYEARYKALAEHIPAVIFVAPLMAGQGDAYVSPQIETMLGFSQEEWLGDPLRWYQQIHPEDRDRWSKEAAALFLSGQPLTSTYRVMARDGRVVWFQCDARMVHSTKGRPSFIHGIGFDVTALKETEASLQRVRDELEMRVTERTRELERTNQQLRAEIVGHQQTEERLVEAKEAAEAATRVKAEFLANMSHEIRTPMNGVLGMTGLALNTKLNQEQREYISLANSSARSLLSVINQILDFSKLESGKARLDVAEFDLRSNIAALVKEFAYAAETKKLTLTSLVAGGFAGPLMGDWGRLRQVLTNLIGNAIKFTNAGEVMLEVEPGSALDTGSGSKGATRFAVSDTGIGIPAEKVSAIFEAFSQADGSVTREYGGTGLGLAISKDLVELMGGTLQVASRVGCGSTFWFTVDLPALGNPGAAQTEINLGTKEELANGRTAGVLRVLVAEDNPVNQKVVKAVLEKRGHRVTVTSNGQEAIEACEAVPFDVVLMDVQMPVMDGLTATKAIRHKEAQMNVTRVPIIGLTAHALEADRDRCLAAGMDRHVSKPFEADELIGLMEELAAR